MSEAVPRARGDHDEARIDAGEKSDRAASVGAVVRRDEDFGPGIRAGGQERPLAAGLEIAGQEDRCASGGASAQNQASIVERTDTVLDPRMKHRQL
jgi:hypothetical protein